MSVDDNFFRLLVNKNSDTGGSVLSSCESAGLEALGPSLQACHEQPATIPFCQPTEALAGSILPAQQQERHTGVWMLHLSLGE